MWKQAFATTLFLVGVLGNGLSDYGSPEISLDYGRIFRPGQDLKILETRYAAGNHHQHYNPVHQLPARKKQSSASRPSQIVYGKPIFFDAAPTRQQQAVRSAVAAAQSNKNFKPSPEDPFLASANQHYSPSQKYLQKYANQLYMAQKNSAYLSEYQKYILNQDPAVKKFVFQQQQQQRGPKQLDLQMGGASTATTVVTTKKKKKVTTTTTTTPVPSTIIPVATTVRARQSKKKVEDLEDNAAQSSLYRFAYRPETVAEYIPVYTSSDKEALALYNQAAAQLSTAQHAHYTPTVQYATTPGYSFAAYHVPAVGVDAGKDEHHEDSSESKYEFKYDVNDNEKNSKFGHAEARKGKTTWGKYYVQLADGRFETVKYWADKTGYHAEVDFKGQAKHPSGVQKEVGLLQDYAHLGAGSDLKQYAADPSQLYAVSETSPVGYH